MKKSKLTKVIACALVVASVLLLKPIGASAEWKQDKNGWWYSEGNSWATGWRAISGSLYYFDSRGYLTDYSPNEFDSNHNIINSDGQFKNITFEGGWAFYKPTGTIVTYLGTDTNIVIPDKIDNVQVTGIGYKSFQANKNITNVSIPNSVNSIGRYAFGGCTSITSFNIPESVKSIGGQALSGCNNLTNITVDENNTSFKSIDGILYSKDGSKLLNYPVNKAGEKFTISKDVTDIGSSAFYGSVNLKSIEIPSSVTIIESGAFGFCKNLSSIIIPDGITNIGVGMFYGCTNLSSINIPDSVTTIERSAFQNCINLSSITIPNSVTRIDDAFNGCKNTIFNVKSEAVKQLLIKSGVNQSKIIM